jgi:predicted transcriptional regulator
MRNADSFGTFLQSMHSLEQETSAARPGQTKMPLDLVQSLASTGPQTVPDLMAASGMDVRDFLDALKTLESAGLVQVVGAAGQQTIQLTPAGDAATRAT